MTTPKTSTLVEVPASFTPSERTANTNSLLVDAGRALVALPSENTRLREDVLDLSMKLSSAEERSAFFELATERAQQGLVALDKISSTVERWVSSGKGIDHWRDVTGQMLNPSFSTLEGAQGEEAPAKQSSDMDSTPAAPHNGTGSGHFRTESVREFLRDHTP